jgi:hypothetical protein
MDEPVQATPQFHEYFGMARIISSSQSCLRSLNEIVNLVAENGKLIVIFPGNSIKVLCVRVSLVGRELPLQGAVVFVEIEASGLNCFRLGVLIGVERTGMDLTKYFGRRVRHF